MNERPGTEQSEVGRAAPKSPDAKLANWHGQGTLRCSARSSLPQPPAHTLSRQGSQDPAQLRLPTLRPRACDLIRSRPQQLGFSLSIDWISDEELKRAVERMTTVNRVSHVYRGESDA